MAVIELAPGVSREAITEPGSYRLAAAKDCQALIECRGEAAREAEIAIEAAPGVRARILFVNHLTAALKSTESIIVSAGADLRVGYLEASGSAMSRQIRARLTGPGAKCEIRTASIASAPADYDTETIHEAPDTTGIMNNYGIVAEKSRLSIICAGRISQGARRSVSRQTSRILTFTDPGLVKVLPILYIDENDVEASHATSIGRPDEDQLYYMESRGLDRKSATGLLTIGYLMPIAKLMDDGQLQKLIAQEITRKVQTWQN